MEKKYKNDTHISIQCIFFLSNPSLEQPCVIKATYIKKKLRSFLNSHVKFYQIYFFQKKFKMKANQVLLCVGNCAVVFLIVSSMFVIEKTSGGILDDVKEMANDAKSQVESSLNNRVCLMNSNCNDKFFRLENYCCSTFCCNMFQYIYRNE